MRYTLIAVLVVGSVAMILASGNIIRKLTNLDTQSASIRFSDITGGLYMCTQGGLLGLGETAVRDSLRVQAGVNQNDSVGLLAMCYTYGLLFGAYYIALMVWAIRKFFQCRQLDFAILIVVFVVLHMTEGLWLLPVYLTFIFCGLKIGPSAEDGIRPLT